MVQILEELIPTEKGGKHENSRAAYTERVSIHLNISQLSTTSKSYSSKSGQNHSSYVTQKGGLKA